jgi:hypothetical protein
MIERTNRLGSGAPCVDVVKVDFEIWDRVLAARPGWRLETMSGASDRADADAMYARTAARDETPPAT